MGTAASRVLGFVRDWLIAVIYGTSVTAQAFVVAFRVPNLLRDLVGEGASNAAFVPVFTRTGAREGKASWVELAQAVWCRLVVSFLIISAVGILAAPLLVRVVAPGFRSSPFLFHLTVDLTRILFPFIGLVGMAAFLMGLLNSVHHFATPSLGPAMLNLCMIAGLLWWPSEAKGLAWGVIAGGILQLAIQWPALKKAGVRLGLQWRNHPGVAQIQRMLVPRMIGSAVYQASVLVDTIFASFPALVGPGGIAALYFAHRFMHLPLALFGISMAQAALPTLSGQAAQGDREGARRTLLMTLRSSLVIAIPASVGLIVLGYPIIRTLLQRGEFSADSTHLTVSALQWYSVGLASLCGVKVLANTLYAYHDTWTPVRSAAISLVVNVVFNCLLVRPMGLGGLALATSLASTFNCLHLYSAVRRRIGPLPAEFLDWSFRVLLASLGMGLIVWALGRFQEGLPWLLFTITIGVASFFLAALLLRVEEVDRLVRWLFRRS